MGASVFWAGPSELAALTNLFTVKDVNGVDQPTDPTTVTLIVTSPSGIATTYTWAGGTVTRVSVGKFTRNVDVSSEFGEWLYQWIGTGTAQDDQVGSWTVWDPALRVYAPIQALKSRLGVGDTIDDSELLGACTAASNAVDEYCNRTGDGFHKALATSARRYRADYATELLLVDDIATLTGLVVKTGSPGNYSATLTLDTDFVVEPANNLAKGRPIYGLRHVRNYSWVNFWFQYNNLPNVEVTATWGWPRIPDGVREATLIKAARLFKRKDSPGGTLGSPDFGVVYISKYEDPDVVGLLEPFIKANQ